MHQRIVRIVPVAGVATRRVMRTLAGFGMGVREHSTSPAPAVSIHVLGRIQSALSGAVNHGRIVLLQGDSGCGKSTHLHAARRALARAGFAPALLDLGAWERPSGASSARTVLDSVPGPHAARLALLASVGLGDALLLAQDPQTLSEGQSARLRIASAVARLSTRRVGRSHPGAPRVLLIDEFASVLDRTSARTLCHTISRLARTRVARGSGLPPLSMVLATAHHDVEAWLSPDDTIHLASPWDAITLPDDQARAA